MAVQTFAMRDLRNHTSEVLDAARQDGEALISNRGRIVARLVPVDPAPASELDGFLAWAEGWQAADTGWAREFSELKQLEADAAMAKPWE